LDEQRLTTPWQQKALTKLLDLRYKICYKQGHTNQVANTLSRVQSDDVFALSAVQPTWMQTLSEIYLQHSDTTSMLQALAVQSPSGHYLIKDGIIFYKKHNPGSNGIGVSIESFPHISCLSN
jgi:hypothetical protein